MPRQTNNPHRRIVKIRNRNGGKGIGAVLSGILLLPLLFWGRAEAVQNLATGAYNTTAPTAADIPNWGTGWPTTGVSGWDYVGMVNGPSGVYLGNGWVITASHVGAGTFYLGANAYTVIPGTAQTLSGTSGTTDITLFQVSSPPSLPSMSVATAAPKALSTSQNGSVVAMIGNGGGKSWGVNSVTKITTLVQVASYTNYDFVTAYGTSTAGSHSATNNYTFIGGDSGGGGFIYNTSTSKWQLSGLNEAVDASHGSYLVQLSNYASQINSVISAASAPGVDTTAATAISATAATLNGMVNSENQSTSVSFEYGTTTGYGARVVVPQSLAASTAQTAVSSALSGLSPGTTYHFRVNAVNTVGTSYGADATFTTPSSALQTWRQTYFGTSDNSGSGADLADPYGTGVSNILVFALLGPSQDPSRVTPNMLPQAQVSGGNIFYSFTQPSGVSGITYGAEWSTTLGSDDWHAISDTGSGSQHIFSAPIGSNTQMFVRLRVTGQ
jgi:hypothetical protein